MSTMAFPHLPSLESLGSSALQKARSQPGLGSHQSASGHTEAVSPAVGSRTSRWLWRPDPLCGLTVLSTC